MLLKLCFTIQLSNGAEIGSVLKKLTFCGCVVLEQTLDFGKMIIYIYIYNISKTFPKRWRKTTEPKKSYEGSKSKRWEFCWLLVNLVHVV